MGEEFAVVSLLDKASSVVCVAATIRNISYDCATGFYIDSKGTVLTASHVVIEYGEDGIHELAVAADIEVVEGTSSQSRRYVISQRLPAIESVLLTPARGEVASTPLLPASEAIVGQKVVVMGYASNSIEPNIVIVATGVLGQTARWGTGALGFRYHILDVLGAVGYSGAPVLNTAGDVIGVVQIIGVNTPTDEFTPGNPFMYASDITGSHYAR